MTVTKSYRSVNDRFRWRYGEIPAIDGLEVCKFTVEPYSLVNMRLARDGRGCLPGDYYRLVVDGTLWMSDTTAEYRDHIDPIVEADRHPGGRGLVNGLGMGLVVAAMLDTLGHVDVVEIDARVIEHIGGRLLEDFGPDKLTIHHDDAYTIDWSKTTEWDVAWHDIWPDLNEGNLTEMGTLHRRYGRRVAWQGSWGKEFLIRHRRQNRYRGW